MRMRKVFLNGFQLVESKRNLRGGSKSFPCLISIREGTNTIFISKALLKNVGLVFEGEKKYFNAEIMLNADNTQLAIVPTDEGEGFTVTRDGNTGNGRIYSKYLIKELVSKGFKGRYKAKIVEDVIMVDVNSSLA